MKTGREKLRLLLSAFVQAAADVPEWRNYNLTKELPEFQAFCEHAKAEQVMERIGVKKPDAGHLWQYYLSPLLSKCMASESVASNFERMYPEFEEAIYAEDATWEVIAPLARFATESAPIEFPNGVTIRPLLKEERDFFQEMLGVTGTVQQGITSARNCLCQQVKAPKAASGVPLIAEDEFQEVLTALRLLKPGTISFNAKAHWIQHPAFGTEYAVGERSGSLSSRAYIHGPLYRLTADDFSRAREIAAALPVIRENMVLSRSLDRFNFGYERRRSDDRLVDFWIALEALFLKKDEQMELSFRAGLRIARFVGESAGDRRAIFESMRKSYGARSKVVHGNPVPGDIIDITNRTEETLRSALRKAVLSRDAPCVADLDAEAVEA